MSETRTHLPVLTRRQFFQIGAVGVSGFFLNPLAHPLNVVANQKVNPRGTAEFCIFINLSGGAGFSCRYLD